MAIERRRNMRKALNIIGIILVGILVVGCAGAPVAKAPKYRNGSYVAVAMGHSGPVKVSTTIAGGRIVEVKVLELSESKNIAEVALERIPKAIIEKQSADVDTVSGATMISEAIIDAVKQALAEASKP
jgi:fumarate reductase flavoprotein subunit